MNMQGMQVSIGHAEACLLAGLLPDKGTLELPPAQWFEHMRTPPAEMLLAEFRQQQGEAVEPRPEEPAHILTDSNELKPASNMGRAQSAPIHQD